MEELKMLFVEDTFFVVFKTVMLTFFTVCMMVTLTDFKYKRKTCIIILGIYMIYVCLSTWLILQFISWYNFSRVFFLTISVPAVILTYFLAKDSPSQAVFNYLTQIDFSLLIIAGCTVLNTACNGTKTSDILLRIAAYILVITFEFRYMRKPFRKITDTLKSSWVMLSIIPIVFLLLLLIIGVFPEHFIKSGWAQLRILCTAIVMIVVYYVVFKSLLKSYSLMEAIRERELLQTQIAAMKRQSAVIHEQERKIVIYRHDMRHYLQNIEALYKNGNEEKAAAFIEQVTKKLDETQLPRYCEHDTLNALFIAYLADAEQEGINITAKIDLPKILPVDELELSMVFANTIENARNACMKISGKQDRFITITCICKPQFIIEIANSYEGVIEVSKEGIPVNREKGHSIGTQSILSFANKYNAILDYDISETIFRLRILLQNVIV